jgi:hypothetical protein
MRAAEHPAKIPSPRTGIFATLSDLLGTHGTGAPSRATLALAPLLATAALFALTGSAAVLALTAAPAAAAGCPNEAIREVEGPAATALPDCRAYEQVSPPGLQKNGLDAIGEAGRVVKASPSGSAVFYFSVDAFAGIPTGYGRPLYLSSRSPASWSTQGLLPLSQEPVFGMDLSALTEDTARSIIGVAEATFPAACEPTVTICGAQPGSDANAYLIDNATGAFHFLAALPLGTRIELAASTPGDSRLLLETTVQLLAAATPGVENLYEWDESKPQGQQLSLVGRLPASEGGSAPVQGSVAGGGPANDQLERGFYSQNAISSDGSRVFFTDRGTGRLYERFTGADETVPIAPGPAVYRAATPDGHYVLYTESGGLYRFDTETETSLALAAPSATVLGALGLSTDGSTAYFDAEAALTGSEQNEWGAAAGPGQPNLYRWHEDPLTHATTTTFIAAQNFSSDWAPYFAYHALSFEPANGAPTSRLSKNGAVLLFASSNPLTSYDNAGQVEFYRYDSASPPGARLSCVTCNPTGATPTASPFLAHPAPDISISPGASSPPILPRNLSADGAVVFFQTNESLLPADTNSVEDVYEWEASGHGSCPSVPPGLQAPYAHCLFLVSSGQSPQTSYFGDASASGEDVFFFTRQPLVSADTDQNVDVYDARVAGGIAAQNPPAAAVECEAEACKPPVSTPPTESTPASENLIGFPNPTYCRSGFIKRNGACVRKPHKHRRHHHKHRRSHRRVGGNRGGGK